MPLRTPLRTPGGVRSGVREKKNHGLKYTILGMSRAAKMYQSGSKHERSLAKMRKN